MAKSFTEQLMEGLSSIGNEVWDDAGLTADALRGIAREATEDPRYQELGRDAGSVMPFLGPLAELTVPSMARMVDVTSERLLGSPLLFGSTTQPVVPGVSKDEANLAATKLADIQAKEAEQNLAHQQQLQDILLSRLQSESQPDTLTFVGRGNDISRGQPMESGGSFSKYHPQSEETRAIDRLMKAGVSPPRGEMLQELARAKTAPEAEATKLGLSMLPEQIDPKEALLKGYQEVMKSKDVRGSLAALRGYAKLLGYSEEQLKQIFPEGL